MVSDLGVVAKFFSYPCWFIPLYSAFVLVALALAPLGLSSNAVLHAPSWFEMVEITFRPESEMALLATNCLFVTIS